MRVFPLYAPKMIAKHAKIFRDGEVLVHHLGRLEFRDGKFVTPVHSRPKVRQAITELNQILQHKAA